MQGAGFSPPPPRCALLSIFLCILQQHRGTEPEPSLTSLGCCWPPRGALGAPVQLSSRFSFCLLTKPEHRNKFLWASRIDLSPLSITQTFRCGLVWYCGHGVRMCLPRLSQPVSEFLCGCSKSTRSLFPGRAEGEATGCRSPLPGTNLHNRIGVVSTFSFVLRWFPSGSPVNTIRAALLVLDIVLLLLVMGP